MRWKNLLKNSWSRRTDRKLYTQSTRWNLGQHVKINHGITAREHLIDPRQMASLKELSASERRHISGIATVRTRWKKVVWLYGMLLLSAKRPGPPGRREDAIWKTIWKTIPRAKNTLWSNGWISSDFTERSGEDSSIWQESITRNLSWLWTDQGGKFGEEIFLIANLEDLEKLDASDLYLRRINAKEVLIRQKNEFIFSIADGTAKLSGRDCELRVPTPRRELTARSKDLSGEMQGESGESWRAEPTDDAKARADFWSIRGYFIYRHHNEPRVQLYVPKEETCPSHWLALMLQGLLILIWMWYKRRVLTIVGMSIQANICQIFWWGFTKFIHSIEREASKRIHVVRRETDKDPNKYKTRSCMARNLEKMVKPLRMQKRNRSSTMLEDWEEFILLIQTTENTQKFFENARRKLQRPMAPAMPCKRHPSIVKTSAKPKIDNEKEFKTIYDCIV